MNNNSEKRFVIFDGTLMQGGAERVISILTHSMVVHGYHVEILLLNDQPIFYEIDEKVKITVVEKQTKTKSLLRNIVWVRKFFQANADIVISFLAPFNMLAIVAHFGLKSKIVVADRNDPRFIPSDSLIRKLRDFLYRFADGVVLQTTQNMEYFKHAIRKKSVVIANPIDLGDKAGQALQCVKEKEIVSVGRLMPQKNQLLLLKAFANIKKDYEDYFLTIYGDGPERENLEKTAYDLGISDSVHFPGSVKDIYDRISKSQIFVLSSNYEGMPNALIEALCLGLPCITTNVSGAEDLITSGTNGEIIPVGDREALECKMRELLTDSLKREEYGRAAVRVNERISVEEIMEQWNSYLLSL